MANVVSKLLVELGVKSDKLKTGLNDASRQVKGFGGIVNKIGPLVAGAFSVAKIVQFTKEAVKLAGEMQGVEEAFYRLDNPQLLYDLRKATRGTISDLELMKQAVKADNFKVPLEKLATYFEFATKRAAQTGESVDYLVNSIITGIGRKSVLVMDNLGISAVQLQEEVSRVGDFGMAAGNIIEKELGRMGDVIVTSTQKTEALNSAWQNFLTFLGKHGTPVFDSIKTSLTNVLNVLSQDPIDEALKKEKGMVDGFVKSLKGLDIEVAKIKIKEEFDKQNKAAFTLNVEYDKMTEKRKKFLGMNMPISAALKKETNDLLAQKTAVNDYVVDLYAMIGSEQEYIDKANKMKEPVKEQIGLIEELTAEIEQLNQELIKATSKEQIIGINVKLNAKQEELDRLKNLLPDRKKLNLEPIALKEPEPFKIDLGLDQLARVRSEASKTQEELDALAESAQRMSDQFISSFSMASGGIENLKNNVLSAAGQTIKAYISEAIAGTVKNALVSVPPPFNLLLAAGAGAAAGSLMNTLIPSFANEGFADREMLAKVGDYPNAKSNPEFMLKQSTIKNLMNSAGGFQTGVFRLRGEDLYLSVQRSGAKLQNRGM